MANSSRPEQGSMSRGRNKLSLVDQVPRQHDYHAGLAGEHVDELGGRSLQMCFPACSPGEPQGYREMLAAIQGIRFLVLVADCGRHSAIRQSSLTQKGG